MAARSPDGRTYLKHACFSVGHSLAFPGLVILAVTVPRDWNTFAVFVCIAVALVTDALLLAVIASIPGFRRSVDADVAERARRAAVLKRGALLSQMSEAHRQQLQELESLVGSIRTSPVARNGSAEQLIHHCGELLAVFVRLAIEHRRGLSHVGSVDRMDLDHEIAMLEKATSAEGQVRALLERRLTILRRRSQLWDTGCTRLRAIEEQLAVLVERIRLAHEDALALRDGEHLGLRVEELVLEEPYLEDVRVEEEIDARMLALGRQPR